MIEDPLLLSLLTPTDLSYYLTLSSLYSLNRKELRDLVLSSSQLKNLMELTPETQDIIENFLNGKYKEF